MFSGSIKRRVRCHRCLVTRYRSIVRVSLRLWRAAVMKRDVKLSLQGHRTIPACNTYKPRNFRYAPWFLPRKVLGERGGHPLYPLSIIWYDVTYSRREQSCNEIFSFSSYVSCSAHVLHVLILFNQEFALPRWETSKIVRKLFFSYASYVAACITSNCYNLLSMKSWK